MDKDILFEKSAIKYCLNCLMEKEDFIVAKLEYLNEGRYAVAYDLTDKAIAILFKKDWFYKFSQMFKNETSIGDSVNREDLKHFAKRGVKTLYVVYKTGEIYMMEISAILEKGHLWTNKEGKELYSYSIHNYKRVNTK